MSAPDTAATRAVLRHTEAPLGVALHCPPSGRAALERALRRGGCAVHAEAAITVIVDAAPGAGHGSLTVAGGRAALLVTANACPEYRLDRSAQHRAALHFSSPEPAEIVRAVWRLHRAPDEPAPLPASPLSLRERAVLRGVAHGLEDREIGERLGIRGAVVRNHVSAILSKLRAAHPEVRLDSRLQLALYYWGLWSKPTHG